jgi:hypothetical protein
MPEYRPKINKNDLKQLEHYKFNLALFIESSEFKYDLHPEKQRRLLNELQYVSMYIDIAKSVFNLSGTEIPIVGWEMYNEEQIKGKYIKIYHFTSATLAAEILNLNNSKVSAVCRGKRPSTGGWIFKYLSDYLEEERTISGIDPTLPFYDLVKTE